SSKKRAAHRRANVHVAPPRRSTALARAERRSAPVRLDTAQTRLLDRALSEGKDLCDRITTAVLEYGRWLLVELFDSDASAGLGGCAAQGRGARAHIAATHGDDPRARGAAERARGHRRGAATALRAT